MALRLTVIGAIVLWFLLQGGPATATPAQISTRTITGARVDVVSVDLSDPATVLAVGLSASRSLIAPPVPPHGETPFGDLVRRWPSAAAANGTFFSLAPGRPVMGTLVTAGVLANHVAWRPTGTELCLAPGGPARLVPAGQLNWRPCWLALAGGPRLLRAGQVVANARAEGIWDPDVLGSATRTAVGLDATGRRMWLASIATPVTLAREAAIMRALGATDALNLDGGSSRALAFGGKVLATPGRPLTQVLLVFDATHPAPAALARARARFRGVAASPPPLAVVGRRLDPGPFEAGRRTPYHKLGRGHGFEFEDWHFRGIGAPVVRNFDGWLDLRQGGGAVYAPWPARVRSPRRFEAVLDVKSPCRIYLDALPEARGWSGFGLDLVPGRVPVLVRLQAGAVTSMLPGRMLLSPGRHWMGVTFSAAKLRVDLDDGEHLLGSRRTPGAGWGAAGKLMVGQPACKP